MSPPDVAASVKARLLAKAHIRKEEFERTLTRFGAERVLYRLGASRERTLHPQERESPDGLGA